MMVKLKPLAQQVVVITGASSGIGLVTAREAARRGAKLALLSRDEADLGKAAEQIRATGGTVTTVVGDVADRDAVQRLADAAIAEYGRIDTWVNNAGVSIYGRVEDVPVEDARRLFETNYWGVVHGTLVALPHLRQRGGALINVGSILSETGYPLQGHYAASKHAVKGFTDSVRLELEEERVPVSVTLIQPAAIDTPYPEHARNYLDAAPKHAPPVYEPQVVADAILSCAVRPHRNVRVGGGAELFSVIERVVPRLGDRFKELTAFEDQHGSEPPRDEDTLYGPRPGDARARGRYPGRVMSTSLYTAARLNPLPALLGAAVIGVGLALAVSRERD